MSISFCWILKIITPGVGFNTIFLPKGLGFRTFFVPGGGEFVLSKILQVFARGGGTVRLGID